MIMKLSCISLLLFSSFLSKGQADGKHEIGLNLTTWATSPFVYYETNSLERINYIQGFTYKYYTENIAYRGYLGGENESFEMDGRKSNGVYSAADTRSFIGMMGVQYCFGKKKFRIAPIVDLKYVRRLTEGENTGGVIAGGRIYSYKENLIGLAPGINFTYIISSKLSVQLESNISLLKNYRNGEELQYGADLTAPVTERLNEVQYKPVSIFSLNLRI
ncbi:MAG: hypothetical protein ACJAR8_000782 [Bacteroidia bacterium]|jgi:hypothetical protein|tara:strand:- start:236 stop:889 length:654 start_codon:yes stop_codon:yes gene_type:complete